MCENRQRHLITSDHTASPISIPISLILSRLRFTPVPLLAESAPTLRNGRGSAADLPDVSQLRVKGQGYTAFIGLLRAVTWAAANARFIL